MKHMPLSRRAVALTAACLSAFGLAGAATLTAGLASAGASTSHSKAFTFKLIAPAAVHACLPHLAGKVTITPGRLNDTMVVSVSGAPKDAGFDLFVIQEPTAPFGLSWYQSDVQTGERGNGTATVRGIFDAETFTVSPGGTVTVPPTHQYHLGLWFDNPSRPFNLGCEGAATSPIVTPFNGEQHAGIQALNTAQFTGAGPLSKVHR